MDEHIMIKNAFSRFFLLLALSAFFLPGLVHAQGVQNTQDRPYVLLQNPQPVSTPGKIEVLEFFSYGCPHCYEMHPHLKNWAAKLPANVVFKRVPVTWNPAWASLAQFYYALEATGDLARLDDAVFSALHVERLRLYDEKSMGNWYAKQGGDSKKFSDAFNSFVVQSKTKQAGQIMQAMNIDGVPALIVEGRYRIQGQTIGQLMTNLDNLVKQLAKPAVQK